MHTTASTTTTTTTAPYRNGTPKTAQIIAGCKALQAAHPGRCFSQAQIADACGVHRRAIGFIERRALQKLALKLGEQVGLLEELYGFRPKTATLHPKQRDVYHTGNPPVRPTLPKPRRAPKSISMESLVASVEFSCAARSLVRV